MAVMKLMVDWVNREFLSAPDRSVLFGRLEDRGLSRQVCDAVASIEFAHICVILRKREPWEVSFQVRAYKFLAYL